MPWNLLGHVGVLALWAACGLLPWLIALFASRGRGALTALPLAAIAGIAGGAVVPLSRADGSVGFAVSLATAFAAGAMTTVLVRRRTATARGRTA